MRLRLGVDAGNLARDRRGLGRVARGIVRAALDDPAFETVLLVDRRDDVRALSAEFAGVAIARTRTAAVRDAYDVVWYPFNGMRFPARAPAVVTIHDAFAFSEPHPERIARAREQRPILTAARSAARIVTVSAWARAAIAHELGIASDAIEIVSNAPSAFWFPANGDTLPAGIAGKRFALLVGVREARKNARLAIDACARVLHEPSEVLVIVGDLSPADLSYARSTGVPCGTIAASDTMLRALYRNAAVVLVPSLAEGFGLVAVEAIACAAPVIAADTSALPEATAGAAWLLDPHDARAWANAIRSLYDDRALAAHMRARAAATFALGDRGAPARRMLAILRTAAGA